MILTLMETTVLATVEGAGGEARLSRLCEATGMKPNSTRRMCIKLTARGLLTASGKLATCSDPRFFRTTKAVG